MKEIKELEDKISGIDKQIRGLEKEKRKINKQILKFDMPEEQKILRWFKNGEKAHADDLFELREKAPEYREWIDGDHMDRYDTYDILHYSFEDVYMILEDPKWGEENYPKEEREEYIKEFIEYGSILMKANIKSFKCDW
jgi:hypothetical protein